MYLLKGDTLTRGKLIFRSYPDNTERSERRAQGDVPLYLLQTNVLKNRAAALECATLGQNYVHLPDWLPATFCDERTYKTSGPIKSVARFPNETPPPAPVKALEKTEGGAGPLKTEKRKIPSA